MCPVLGNLPILVVALFMVLQLEYGFAFDWPCSNFNRPVALLRGQEYSTTVKGIRDVHGGATRAGAAGLLSEKLSAVDQRGFLFLLLCGLFVGLPSGAVC